MQAYSLLQPPIIPVTFFKEMAEVTQVLTGTLSQVLALPSDAHVGELSGYVASHTNSIRERLPALAAFGNNAGFKTVKRNWGALLLVWPVQLPL